MDKVQQINCKVKNCAHNSNGRECALKEITVTSMPSHEDNINESICASFDTK